MDVGCHQQPEVRAATAARILPILPRSAGRALKPGFTLAAHWTPIFPRFSYAST
jgi:hypothetical protein